MQVEITQRWNSGIPIRLPDVDVEYYFSDDGTGRFVCDVDERHLKYFEAAPGGFRIVRDFASPPAGIGTEPLSLPAGDSKTVDDMTDEELREYAKAKYDRKFHPSAKRDTMLAEIANLGG